jgi:hypothetical protein
MPPSRVTSPQVASACAGGMIGPSDNTGGILVPRALLPDTASMWYAICSNKDCGWDHVASSQISAMVYADSHLLDCYPQWSSHRVFIVDIPDEPPPQQPSSA